MRQIGKMLMAACMALVLAVTALAQAPAEPAESAAKMPYTLAVLNFEVGDKLDAQLGRNVPDLLSAFLAADETLQLVERAKINEILNELALGQSGVVDTASQAKIGYLTGAQFLVTGRVFIVGNQLFITTKVMSAETSKVRPQVAKAATSTDMDVIIQDLSEKISADMAKHAAGMLPKPMTFKEVLATLKDKLKGNDLPRFAVIISESHVNRATVDPAAETEFGYLLKGLGAELVDTKVEGLSEWARSALKKDEANTPLNLLDTDIIIVGEGFSEYAGTLEKLISVKARLEVKALDKQGRVLAVGRANATAVDLAENIAAKSALQKAAEKVALTLIPDAVEAYKKSAKKANNE